MSVSTARRIAFEVLHRVESGGAYASDLLHSKLDQIQNPADAALATQITMGVLRWQRLLDFLLQRKLNSRIEKLDAEVLLTLRIGLYQLRFLDRVPARAAINESVELTKLAKKRSAAALVNAALRRSEADAKLAVPSLESLLSENSSIAERLGVFWSHPTWLVERWVAQYGESKTRALLEKNNNAPQLTCSVLNSENASQITESLKRDRVSVQESRWLTSALTITSGNPAKTEAFQRGEISIQDEASQMVPRLLEARVGDFVLDLCSAPGGKTGILALAVAPEGSVIAADVHEHRLRSAREQLARAATSNVKWIRLDAAQPLPFDRMFDRILVDAPCAGTGTLARNPEIKWRLKPQDLKTAHELQTAILEQALAKLSPGGRLVYATCSLEREENEDVIREVLSDRPDLRLVSGAKSLQPWLRQGTSASQFFDEQGFFRTFPPSIGTDGFFAAVLERKS